LIIQHNRAFVKHFLKNIFGIFIHSYWINIHV
jgi:hypothetical protein